MNNIYSPPQSQPAKGGNGTGGEAPPPVTMWRQAASLFITTLLVCLPVLPFLIVRNNDLLQAILFSLVAVFAELFVCGYMLSKLQQPQQGQSVVTTLLGVVKNAFKNYLSAVVVYIVMWLVMLASGLAAGFLINVSAGSAPGVAAALMASILLYLALSNRLLPAYFIVLQENKTGPQAIIESLRRTKGDALWLMTLMLPVAVLWFVTVSIFGLERFMWFSNGPFGTAIPLHLIFTIITLAVGALDAVVYHHRYQRAEPSRWG